MAVSYASSNPSVSLSCPSSASSSCSVSDPVRSTVSPPFPDFLLTDGVVVVEAAEAEAEEEEAPVPLPLPLPLKNCFRFF